MDSQIEHTFIKTNGVSLHVALSGPDGGPLVILLHGYPEFWQGWKHQIPSLVRSGCRVWVPDQRGYNLSEKPGSIAAYNLDELTCDVIGLIDAAKQDKAVIIGHDWGGAVAWWVANKFPERVEKLIILNVPHYRIMRQLINNSWAQKRKSWYMFFFQIPRLPEILVKAGNWRSNVQTMRSSSRPGTFTDADFEVYRQAWSQPGAIRGMLNWYRAMMQTTPERLPSHRIVVPTLMIWGRKDLFIGEEGAQKSIELCDNGRLEFIDEATHWIHHEEPERVNHLMLDFIAEETG